MNSSTIRDHGTLARAHFEHARRTDADFRRIVYDSRIAMYKTTYERDFYWPEHVPKLNDRRAEPEFAVIPKLTGRELEQLYTPDVIHRKLSDRKRIEPPLEYSNDAPLKDGAGGSKNSTETFAKSLYQETYNVNRTPCRTNDKEETSEEWTRRWSNECHNLRDADDLVQDWSHRVIGTQRISLNRKRIGRGKS